MLPPFASLDGSRSVGLVVRIVEAAARQAGHEVAFVAVPFRQIEQALHDERAHLAIPIAATPERRTRFDFTGTLLATGGSIFVCADEPMPDGLHTLSGKTVVTPRTGPLAAFIARTAPAVRLVVTTDYEESLDMLVGGRADAAALNHQAGAMIARQRHPGRIRMPERMFLELPFVAAALRGRHADLISALDAGLSALVTSGRYHELCNT
jgi:polar amino acid transport system substrate-binding protein